LPFCEEIGSHLLVADKSLADTTGNGSYNRSAYEFYLLINLKFEGRSLYQLLKAGDEDVISVLALLTPEVTGVGNAQGQADHLIQVIEPKVKSPATGKRGKQLYWLVSGSPIDDLSYELRIPFYPSSLVHAVCGMIEGLIFSSQNKEALEEKRLNKPHEGIT